MLWSKPSCTQGLGELPQTPKEYSASTKTLCNTHNEKTRTDKNPTRSKKPTQYDPASIIVEIWNKSLQSLHQTTVDLQLWQQVSRSDNHSSTRSVGLICKTLIPTLCFSTCGYIATSPNVRGSWRGDIMNANEWLGELEESMQTSDEEKN